MASYLPVKRILSSNIIPNVLRRIVGPSADSYSRFFNTNVVRKYDDDGDDRDMDIDRRSDSSVPRRRDDFFTEMFNPFSSKRSLSQVLNLMDEMTENSLISGFRPGWDAEETDNALNLRIDMPGLGKEDVKVYVEQNTLVIKGEGDKQENEKMRTRAFAGIQAGLICRRRFTRLTTSRLR